MIKRVFYSSIGAFSEKGDIFRKPRRPEPEWTPEFWSKFDRFTAFTDAFQTGPDIHLVGPALENLRQHLEAAQWRVDGQGVTPTFVDRHLMHHSVITGVGPAARIQVKGKDIEVEQAVGIDGAELFEKRRVLLTVSKNNPLTWILDWVRFHRDVHGADAVLIVDNGSTHYTLHELLDAVASLKGLTACVIVSIDVPYGPGPNLAKNWDANFMQFTAIEHMRWRFLRKAAGVLQGDIDELVVPLRETTCFNAAQESPDGVLMYGGEYLPPVNVPREGIARHKDQYSRDLTRPRSGAKYTVSVPHSIPEEQWLVHSVRGHSELSGKFRIAHLQAINTGWKHKFTHRDFDPQKHEHDHDLIKAYERTSWHN